MLEESNGFFLDWGYAWLSWNQLFAATMVMIFGPFLMCYQTKNTWKWIQSQKEKQNNLSVEEDDEFEADETVVVEATEESKTEEVIPITDTEPEEGKKEK